jgi:hypothetical protein
VEIRQLAEAAEESSSNTSDGVLRNDVSTFSGTFIFQEKYTKDIYKVKYSFDLGHGVTQYTYENVRRDDKTMWISEFFIGETIEPQTPLALVGDVQ